MVTVNSRKSLAIVAAIAGFSSCAGPVFGATTLASQNNINRGWKTGGVKVTSVPVSGQPFKTAVALTSPRKTANVWDAQVGMSMNSPLRRGDNLLATFYIRSARPSGQVTFSIEGGGPPRYEQLVWRPIRLSNKWQKVSIPVTSRGTYGPGKWNVTFKLGAMAQTVQVGGFRVVKR